MSTGNPNNPPPSSNGTNGYAPGSLGVFGGGAPGGSAQANNTGSPAVASTPNPNYPVSASGQSTGTNQPAGTVGISQTPQGEYGGSNSPGGGSNLFSDQPGGAGVIYNNDPASSYNTPGATETGYAWNGGDPTANSGPNATTAGIAGNAGTWGTSNAQGEAGGTVVQAAPASLYNWNGPTANQELAMQQAAMSQQAAQINPNVTGVGAGYLNATNAGFSQEGAGQAISAGGLANSQMGLAAMGQQYGVGGALEGTLGQEIQGKGPNPALLQAQQSQQANLAQQLAMAANTKGAGQGTAGYNAMQNAGQANATINQQATIAGEQQQLAAQGQLASMQGQMAGQGAQASQIGLGQAAAGTAMGGLGLQAGQLGLTAQGQLEGQAEQVAAGNAQLQQAQNSLSDQTALGYNSNALAAGSNQLNAGIAEGTNIENAQTASGNLALGLQANNTSQNNTFLGGLNSLTGGGQSTGAGNLQSDINSKQDVVPSGGQSQQQMTRAVQNARPAPSLGLSTGSAPFPGSTSLGQMAGTNPAGSGQMMPVPQQQAPMGPAYMSLASDPWLKSDAVPAGANTNVQLSGASMPQPTQATSTQSLLSAQSAAPGYKTQFTPQSAGASGAQTASTMASDVGTAASLLSDVDVKEDVTNAGQAAGSETSSLMSQQSPSGEYATHAPSSGSGSDGMGSAVGDVASIAMLAMSDRRAKQMIRPAGTTVSDDFLKALSESESTYKYKDPKNEPTAKPTGSRYLGVMAQAVEKTPTGDTIVKDGPRGKYLEMGPALSAALAGEGRLNERLTAVEHALMRAIEVIQSRERPRAELGMRMGGR